MVKSDDYWEKRRELEDKARLKMEGATVQKINRAIYKAMEQIQAELLSQADLHNMTEIDLLTDFSNRDQAAYKKYVQRNYEELMSSNEKYQEFVNRFFPKYDYAKINRLSQIKADISSILFSEVMGEDLNASLEKNLEDVLNKTYNSNSKTLATLMGGGEYHPLPKEELSNILNYPWSGETFSTRLWGNVSSLEKRISDSIVQSVVRGEGMLDVLKTTRNDPNICDMFKLEFDKFSHATTRLVRTEYAHFAIEGVKKSIEDAGIEKMRAWSAEDERVCDVCGSRHGKLIKDSWFPPYHPLCRCSITPVLDDIPDDIDEIYEEMFGDLLDEFARNRFGVQLDNSGKLKGRYFNESIASKLTTEQLQFYQELLQNANKDVLAMWDRFSDELTLGSTTEKSAHYAPAGRKVNMHIEEDVKGSWYSKPGNTFYHEFGHNIDFLANGGNNAITADFKLSNGKTLGETVYSDVQAKVKSIGKEKKIKALFARGEIKQQLASLQEKDGTIVSSISDLYGGATNNQAKSRVGHSDGYWKLSAMQKRYSKVTNAQYRDAQLGVEAFAEFTAAALMDKDELALLREWLPETYRMYFELVNEIMRR